jgi:signal transduction histidine kinase
MTQPAAARMLPMMERQVAHISRLLDDLLDASRIDNDKVELLLEPLDLAALLHRSIDSLRLPAAERGHRFTLEAPASGVVVMADPVRIMQIVTNLLDNAA